MNLAGVLSAEVWPYSTHNNRLVERGVGSAERRRELRGPIATIGVFGVSIGFAFINADLAKLSSILITVVLRLLG
jgi:hypothetical protein